MRKNVHLSAEDASDRARYEGAKAHAKELGVSFTVGGHRPSNFPPKAETTNLPVARACRVAGRDVVYHDHCWSEITPDSDIRVTALIYARDSDWADDECAHCEKLIREEPAS